MNRLTTDDEKSMFYCFNLFYAKDREIWVRGGGAWPEYKDVTLVQWIRSAASKHGLNLTAEDPEHLGDEMYDALQDGDETVEGIVALLHAAAVQATEMRERLKTIEDILGNDYDLDHIKNMVEADQDGRIKILPEGDQGTCGTCNHFRRTPGTNSGSCDVKKFKKDRYGKEDRSRKFVAQRSTKGCKHWEKKV